MSIHSMQPRDLPKDAILDAAKNLIALNGYEGLSIRDLARDSGLAKGTIYYHFADKEQIYLHVLERDLIMTRDLLTQAVKCDGSCHERLRSLIETYSELIWINRSLFVARLREINEMSNSVQQLLRKHRPTIVEPIESLLQEGIDSGIFRPINIDFAVVSLFGMMNSFVTHRLVLGENDAGQNNGTMQLKKKPLKKKKVEKIQDEIVEHTFELFVHAISK